MIRLICSLVLLAITCAAQTSGKKRVAVLDFDYGTVQSYVSSIYGSNQENVAYPSGLCAERVALFYWGANHPDDPIEAMAITARTDEFLLTKPVTSCGSCLQVLAEVEKKQDKPIKVILYAEQGPVWIVKGIENQLPFLFFEERLTT